MSAICIRIDGTCIEEGAEDVTVQGNFIISRRVVYDKTGQRLTMIQENESVWTVLYDEILINSIFQMAVIIRNV